MTVVDATISNSKMTFGDWMTRYINLIAEQARMERSAAEEIVKSPARNVTSNSSTRAKIRSRLRTRKFKAGTSSPRSRGH